jgi:hypothetical protein
MSDRRPMRRPSAALDHRSLGLWFGLGSAVVIVGVIGIAPIALALGLLALLVVD